LKYLIGIDLGTSATKTVLFDQRGAIVSSSSAEYPLYQPQNGWAEQDPADWRRAAFSTIAGVIKASGVNPADIAGVGISGQMHGLVMLGEDGEPLRNAIIWCDGRTERECAEITDIIGAKRLIELSANPALPGFTASKIMWVRKHEPEIYAKCRHILLPKDYIRYALTGEFATEVSDASGMNLLDVPRRGWSGEILDKLEIDGNMLPRMYESCEVTGRVTAAAAASTGLAPGTPVVGGAGDNAAAAVGTGVVSGGRAFTTIGTSGVIFAHSDAVAIEPEGRVHAFCSAVPGAWTVMSCTLAAGMSLQWFRNNFCRAEMETAAAIGTDPYDLMGREAEQSPIGANRLLFLPYLMGERSPILDSSARGVFFGLSAMHTKRDMIRAVMEGVAYSQRECLDVLRGMGINPGSMTLCGGGAASPLWRSMLADVYACPVCTVTSKEGPALGAAILAGVGAGLYNSVPEACAELVKTTPEQPPNAENGGKYEGYYKLYKELYPRLKDQFSALMNL